MGLCSSAAVSHPRDPLTLSFPDPIEQKKYDTSRQSEAFKCAFSLERRARHGFQIAISFAGGKLSEPFDLGSDSKTFMVDSGFMIAKCFFADLCKNLFLSVEEGRRHCYFDWMAMHRLPGTIQETSKGPDGLIRVKPLNDHWKCLYDTAVGECKVVLFILTNEWLESKYCRGEFQALVQREAGKNWAQRETQPIFLMIQTSIKTNPKFTEFKQECDKQFGAEFWDDYAYWWTPDMSLSQCQDDMHYCTFDYAYWWTPDMSLSQVGAMGAKLLLTAVPRLEVWPLRATRPMTVGRFNMSYIPSLKFVASAVKHLNFDKLAAEAHVDMVKERQDAMRRLEDYLDEWFAKDLKKNGPVQATTVDKSATGT
eukprot:g56464.t1